MSTPDIWQKEAIAFLAADDKDRTRFVKCAAPEQRP
jgi:hypothetical protein